MKLSLVIPKYYRVKRGQTVASIARTYHLPPRYLAVKNGLTEEVYEGQVLVIPPQEGDLYTVKGGESREKLSGSRANFEKKNGACLFIGQEVFL